MNPYFTRNRAVPEWIGRTPDSKLPDEVKLRIWERVGGRCHISSRKIMPSDAYDWEHIIPLSQWSGDGHGNRESNIAPALRGKHREKTKAEAKVRAKGKRIRKKHLGIRKATTLNGAGFARVPPQRKASTPIKPKFDGDIAARKATT